MRECFTEKIYPIFYGVPKELKPVPKKDYPAYLSKIIFRYKPFYDYESDFESEANSLTMGYDKQILNKFKYF